jgi:hypothetical protein
MKLMPEGLGIVDHFKIICPRKGENGSFSRYGHIGKPVTKAVLKYSRATEFCHCFTIGQKPAPHAL